MTRACAIPRPAFAEFAPVSVIGAREQVTGSLAPVNDSLGAVAGSREQMTDSLAAVTGSLAEMTDSLAAVTGSLAEMTGSLAAISHSREWMTGSLARRAGSWESVIHSQSLLSIAQYTDIAVATALCRRAAPDAPTERGGYNSSRHSVTRTSIGTQSTPPERKGRV
jgi:hypothetical protein